MSVSQAVLLIVSDDELPAARRVWGTGGWNMPGDREGLDWLTLMRFLGWRVDLASSEMPPRQTEDLLVRCAIVASPPEKLAEGWIWAIERLAGERPLLVVAQAGTKSSPLARIAGTHRGPGSTSSKELVWTGPGSHCSWNLRKETRAFEIARTGDTEVWARLGDVPLVVAARLARSFIVTLAFHPSAGRDDDGALCALLTHLLTRGVSTPTARWDFERTLLLRMDDPGGAQNVHNRGWYYRKLTESEWGEIGFELNRRDARISIGYTPGWVDDGNSTRGRLAIGGEEVERVPGHIYPSPLVRYEDLSGHASGTLHDYESEYRGIQRIRAVGRGDVELHGFTHVHPDLRAWLSAPDRYDSMSWYRELGPRAQRVIETRRSSEHPLSMGASLLYRYFGQSPTTLIPPGDEWTDSALECALDLGLSLVDSYYLAIRHDGRFCWTTHVCSPYLSEPDPSWFDAGLPVVGYFHDYEPSVHGTSWVAAWLDRWEEAGARRFIDFRELASAIGRRIHLELKGGAWHLRVDAACAPELVRDVPVRLSFPPRDLPVTITVECDGRHYEEQVIKRDEGEGSIFIRCLPMG